MVKHIVMYILRDDCNKSAAIKEIKNALENLVGIIPGLIEMKIRPTMDGKFDYILYSVFDSKESLELYKNHPEHLKVKPIVHGYIVDRVAADFEE